MLRAAARALAALGLLSLSGCYAYVPAELQSVPAGERVRVRVGRGAAAELAEVMPIGDGVVRGTLVRRDPERVFVRVPITRREGFTNQPITQDVGIAAGEILLVELRRRSAGKTALFVGGTAAVATAVVVGILRGGNRRLIDELPAPDELRIPFGH